MPGSVTVVGIGPGAQGHLTSLAMQALGRAEVVVGYGYYFRFVEHLLSPGCRRIKRELSEETERAEIALEIAKEGGNVAVISSGDSGIYGMASVVLLAAQRGKSPVEVSVIPGVSAFVAASAKLGAPLGHDFCSISLSDLLTPWRKIEKRIASAANGDFVTVVHNPRSTKRYWQLPRLIEIFLSARGPQTPVGVVRHVSREEERVHVTTLELLSPEEVNMFTVLIIGNSSTFSAGGRMITPRSERNDVLGTSDPAHDIYKKSFKTVERFLKSPNSSGEGALRAIKRCVHTTADFEYETLFHCSDEAIEKWNLGLAGGEIVTDVKMVLAGVSKRLAERKGTKVFCYLDTPESLKIASQEGITRSQAAMRVAIQKHPTALFAVGNAPTALIEIADTLSRLNTEQKRFNPLGVIGAPVGFVNVEQSKTRLEAAAGDDVPFVVIRGRKGGSGVAAAIINAALGFDEDEF